jgi:hypothetical protein
VFKLAFNLELTNQLASIIPPINIIDGKLNPNISCYFNFYKVIKLTTKFEPIFKNVNVVLLNKNLEDMATN